MALLTISNFLVLRIKQSIRFISNMGFGVLIILPFIIVILLNGYNYFLKNPVIIFQSLLALIIITIHTKRRDKKFLAVLKLKGLIILHLEYFLIITILSIPLLVKNGGNAKLIAPYFICSMFLFADRLIKKNLKIQFNLIKKITSLFPIDTYEWKVGIRKNSILFSISYILGIVLLPFAPVTPFFILYWCMFSGEFYKEIENKEIIQSYTITNNFLKLKLKSLISLLNVIFLPHYILFMIWNFTGLNIIILLLFILLMNLIFTYALLLKYSLIDFTKRTIDNTVSLTIFLIISPILFLSLPLEWNTFNKAKWKIQKLLK